jgi:hypothetical protein
LFLFGYSQSGVVLGIGHLSARCNRCVRPQELAHPCGGAGHGRFVAPFLYALNPRDERGDLVRGALGVRLVVSVEKEEGCLDCFQEVSIDGKYKSRVE